MSADWQKGAPLDWLRALAAPFKAHHKPLVFGAFGLTKEREIAEALHRDTLLFNGSPPSTVLLWHHLSRSSAHRDFAGNDISLYAPSYFCTALAAESTGAAQEALRVWKLRLGTRHRFYVEIFEEDLAVKDALLREGFVWVGSKVMAGSEIKGIYAQEDEQAIHYTRDEEATLAILVPRFMSGIALSTLVPKLQRFDGWAQHYSSYNKRKSWTSFALRGYSDDPLDIVKPSEMSAAWKHEHSERMSDKPRWLPIAKRFPEVRAALALLPCSEFDRVRFMRLRAEDGELTRHADVTDRDAGVRDGKIARLHVPIITNPDVVFSGWNARGERINKVLHAGCLAYLDQRKPHAVVNRGGSDRVHLVIDCVSNKALRNLIAKAPT